MGLISRVSSRTYRQEMSEILPPIIEQYGGVQSFSKDPFYGPLMKTIRKRQKKALKIQQEHNNNEQSSVPSTSTPTATKTDRFYNTEWKNSNTEKKRKISES